MKKQILLVLLIFLSIFLSVFKVSAAEDTFYSGIKSPRYNATDMSSIYDHSGYYYHTEGGGVLSTTRQTVYHDVYIRDYYKISYFGVLGTPQMTFYTDYPVVYQGTKIILNEIGFIMNEEMVHTNSFTLGMTVSIYEVSETLGLTWTRVSWYGNNLKILSELGENSNGDPFVIMPVYKIEAVVKEAVHTGVSTRPLFGTWSPYAWTTTYTAPQNITVGYVGFYYYLGTNNSEYESAYYLYNNSDVFTYPEYRVY